MVPSRFVYKLREAVVVRHGGLEPEDAEHDRDGEDGRDQVDDAGHDGVLCAVVFARQVRRVGDYAAER